MTLSSRERILRAADFEETDYAPLSFLVFNGLEMRCSSTEEYLTRQLELGVDAVVTLPGVGWTFPPEVEIEVRREEREPHPLIHKVYRTPKGDFSAIGEKVPDWPWDDDFPLLDHRLMARAKKLFLTGEEDLGPMEALLNDPNAEETSAFRSRAAALKRFAEEHSLAVTAGGGGLGAGFISNLAGPTQLATWSLTDPDLLREALRIYWRWESKRLELAIEARPDIIVGGDHFASAFLSPAAFEEYLGDILREHISAAHSVGARYCYVGTVDMMPYLGILTQYGVDLIYGLDPIEGRWDLERVKAECAGSIALWGGVNGYLQLCHGTLADAERAAESAMENFAPGGGFILGPVDDVCLYGTGHDTEENWRKTWDNVVRMVEVWKKLR